MGDDKKALIARLKQERSKNQCRVCGKPCKVGVSACDEHLKELARILSIGLH